MPSLGPPSCLKCSVGSTRIHVSSFRRVDADMMAIRSSSCFVGCSRRYRRRACRVYSISGRPEDGHAKRGRQPSWPRRWCWWGEWRRLGGLGAPLPPLGVPVAVDNCRRQLTFDRPPERAVTGYQNTIEVMLALGLGDRIIAGQGFPQSPLLPEQEAAYHAIAEISSGEPGDQTATKEVTVPLEPDFFYMGGTYFVDGARGLAIEEDLERNEAQVCLHGLRCPLYVSYARRRGHPALDRGRIQPDRGDREDLRCARPRCGADRPDARGDRGGSAKCRGAVRLRVFVRSSSGPEGAGVRNLGPTLRLHGHRRRTSKRTRRSPRSSAMRPPASRNRPPSSRWRSRTVPMTTAPWPPRPVRPASAGHRIRPVLVPASPAIQSHRPALSLSRAARNRTRCRPGRRRQAREWPQADPAEPSR